MLKDTTVPRWSRRWLIQASLAAPLLLAGASAEKSGDRQINFPDLPGYQTLAGDFHVHTVFSDGRVWPTIRVEEALKEGLDAIAITDHVEYRPHLADIPNPDKNRSHVIARQAVKGRALLVLRGAEITRGMPPGHLNAIFVEDVNRLVPDVPAAYLPQLGRRGATPEAEKLLAESALTVLREAARQGAFVIWNHPGWLQQTPNGIATWSEMHALMLKENLFQGIEIANGSGAFSEEALQIALEHNLTFIGNSDIHDPVGLQDENPPPSERRNGSHRTLTLIFAKEKTEPALKEALRERRTVVWWDNILIGRNQWLVPLVEASITATTSGYLPPEVKTEDPAKASVINIELKNSSDADYLLRNLSPFSMTSHIDVLTVPAHRTTRIQVKTKERLPRVVLPFEVLNALVAPRTHPTITLTVETGIK